MRPSPLEKAVILVAFFVSAVNPGLARNLGDPPKPGFNLYSKQQDIELGRQAASRILQQNQQVQSI